MKISACTPPPAGARVDQHPQVPKSIWHSTPGSPSATRTVAAVRPKPHRSTQNRCKVRYGTTTPRRSSSTAFFTTAGPSFTRATICSRQAASRSHACPCPPAVPDEPPYHLADQLIRQLPGPAIAAQPSPYRRLYVPADRLAVDPRPLSDLSQTRSLQPVP